MPGVVEHLAGAHVGLQDVEAPALGPQLVIDRTVIGIGPPVDLNLRCDRVSRRVRNTASSNYSCVVQAVSFCVNKFSKPFGVSVLKWRATRRIRLVVTLESGPAGKTETQMPTP
jgi:hypothetical protein